MTGEEDVVEIERWGAQDLLGGTRTPRCSRASLNVNRRARARPIERTASVDG